MTEVNGDAWRSDMQVLFQRRDDGVHFEVVNPRPIVFTNEEAEAIGNSLLKIARSDAHGVHHFLQVGDFPTVTSVLEAA